MVSSILRRRPSLTLLYYMKINLLLFEQFLCCSSRFLSILIYYYWIWAVLTPSHIRPSFTALKWVLFSVLFAWGNEWLWTRGPLTSLELLGSSPSQCFRWKDDKVLIINHHIHSILVLFNFRPFHPEAAHKGVVNSILGCLVKTGMAQLRWGSWSRSRSRQ